jgi:capsid protein
MSSPNNKRRQRGSRGRGGRAAEIADYQTASNFLQSMSGFDGANQSTRRGWIYWPSLDTKRDLDTYSRNEMVRKARWLRANFGLANRITGGLADMIGYLTPLSNSGNEDYDEILDDHWEDRTKEPGVIDASGMFSISEMQIEWNKAAFGDGDVLALLLQTENGLQIANYESPMIRNPDPAGEDWIDGVRLDKFRRHLTYGIGSSEKSGVRSISARDCIYIAHPDSLGRVRPPTILKHAINHLIDISEILADVKLTIKVAAQMGLYLKTASPSANGHYGAHAIGSGLRNETVAAASGSGETALPERTVQVEDFYRAQGGLANLPTGADIGTIQDTRPHPNMLALTDYLVRDIAWGVGVAPELLWNIEKLRGANNRLVNSDLDRWIARKLLRQKTWVRKLRATWISQEIQAGRIPPPPPDAKYWRAAFIPQASLTADKGRIGSLNIELIKNRMLSLADYYAEGGKDWWAELKQIAKEKKALKELGLLIEDVERTTGRAA